MCSADAANLSLYCLSPKHRTPKHYPISSEGLNISMRSTLVFGQLMASCAAACLKSSSAVCFRLKHDLAIVDALHETTRNGLQPFQWPGRLASMPGCRKDPGRLMTMLDCPESLESGLCDNLHAAIIKPARQPT